MGMGITTHRKGIRIGVSRDGKGIGLATNMGKGCGWTANAYTSQVPYDRWIGVFPTADEAAAAIAKVGEAKR